MLEIYRALFVDPSLQTLLPIVGLVVVGTVLSAVRRIARFGVAVLITGIIALAIYLAWQAGMIQSLLTQLPTPFAS